MRSVLSRRPAKFVQLFLSRMRSEGFPFIVWGSGRWTRVRVVCCLSARSRRRVVVNSLPWGLASGRVACAHGGRAFRVAGVGLRMHVRAREGTGGWIRVAGVGKRAFGPWCACVSRGRCGARWPPEVSGTWICVAGVGKRARSVRFAWQAWGMVRPVASLGIVLRGRRRESCAAAEIARFRGPVRDIGCAGARSRVRRCEIVAGAGNSWTCGCELGSGVLWWNAAAGCIRRVACAALCRGTQWQAVGMGVGRVACVACVALCVVWVALRHWDW